jgi:hypothetical protein
MLNLMEIQMGTEHETISEITPKNFFCNNNTSVLFNGLKKIYCRPEVRRNLFSISEHIIPEDNGCPNPAQDPGVRVCVLKDQYGLILQHDFSL